MSRERYEREHEWIIDNNKRKTNESLIVYDEEWNTLDDLCELLNQQSQRIAELEEQLKNAIVPKFKVGQEVFFKLWDGQEAIGGIIDVQYSTTSGVMYEIQYSDGWESDSDWFEEKDVWSKEEAQAKLKELKGE